MESISFFIKSFLIAFIAVLLMQVEIGGATVEDHILSFVHTSSISQPLKTIADGGVKAIRNGWSVLSRLVNNNKPAVGERASSFFNMNRSEGYRKSEDTKKSSDDSSE
jgi:hypothetical protein